MQNGLKQLILLFEQLKNILGGQTRIEQSSGIIDTQNKPLEIKSNIYNSTFINSNFGNLCYKYWICSAYFAWLYCWNVLTNK